MKDIEIRRNLDMNSLELPQMSKHHTFYLSSCESGTGIDSHESSRHSSTASLPISERSSTANPFLKVLKRLHYSTLRRQTHVEYRTSLHHFFKKPHHSIENQLFYKSHSYPLLTTVKCKKSTNRSYRELHSNSMQHNQLANKTSSKFRFNHIRRLSDKTVSEDNNTNTMNSCDLPTVHITDMMSMQQNMLCETRCVSFCETIIR